MSKKITNEEFIEKSKLIHGDRYDYSKVEYKGAKENVCIICHEHGEFWQTPSKHIIGQGCPKCGSESRIKKRTFSIEEFIEKAKIIHGDKFDYSKVDYKSSQEKVCIICPIHGKFYQTPNGHLHGNGCAKCGGVGKYTTKEFIEKAKLVYSEKYDYSKVEYENINTKVCIICPIHGEFYQTPNTHLLGHGCNKCGVNTRKLKRTFHTSFFIERAKKVHEGKYDYSKVEYINARSNVCIICPIHGEFWQNAYSHSHGKGCPNCGIYTATVKNRSDTFSFVEKAKVIHGDKYDYSKVEYQNRNNDNVNIFCPIHGEFWQAPCSHLRGRGCPKCGKKTSILKKSSDTETFILKANKVHDNKYDYSKVEYINAITKVCIICPKHGEFYQRASDHLQGKGCPKCNSTFSKAEEYISKYIQELGIEIIQNDRKILDGFELDIYIPSHNLAIEYNGLRWHSEEFGKDKYYHINKTLQCKEKGIKLIHVFEDEYLEHKDIVINKIKHILGISEELPKIMGRKCTIEVIDNDTAKSFLNTYHIQGYGRSTTHLGAVCGNELIAVMSFKKEGKDCLKWELTRFASHNNYICQGVGGKLFKYFINTYHPQEVKSFADRRWTLNEEDNLYTKLEFELGQILLPDYRYVVGNERKHKFGFRKQILNKKYGLPLTMTEKEMVESLGIKKIWDCGLLKYVWKRHD